MGTISGKDGQVKEGATVLAEITHWVFRTAAKNRAYSSSATGGFKRRLPGVKHGEGKFSYKLSATSPQTQQFEEGDAVTLALVIDADNAYSVPAVIDSVQLEVNVDTGEPIGGTAEFSSNGAWTKPAFEA